MGHGISVILIAHNAERTLDACLRSVESVADELILVDGGSSDATRAIAKAHGAKIFERRLESFGAQKQYALDQAASEWVFLIDSDEVAPPELLEEIKSATRARDYSAYRLPRKNLYFGRWLKHGGKYPDYQTRLLNRSACRFSDDLVHEKIVVSGNTGQLETALVHHSYPDLETWLQKLKLFASFKAETWRKSGARPSAFGFVYHVLWIPQWRFFRKYFLKFGFADGSAGFLACLHDALTEILAYLLFSGSIQLEPQTPARRP